jgi:hypothetical protein
VTDSLADLHALANAVANFIAIEIKNPLVSDNTDAPLLFRLGTIRLGLNLLSESGYSGDTRCLRFRKQRETHES